MKHENINKVLLDLVDIVLHKEKDSKIDENKLITIAKDAEFYIKEELTEDVKEEFSWFLQKRYKDLPIHKAIRNKDKRFFSEYISLCRQDNTMMYYNDILDFVFEVLNNELDRLYGKEYTGVKNGKR